MRKTLIFLFVHCYLLFSTLLTGCDNEFVKGILPDKPPRCIVTFDFDNGAKTESKTVIKGERAEKPTPDPVKKGYYFACWFNTENDAEWDFNAKVTKDIHLKAKWELKTYTVILYADNGGESEIFYIPEGGKVEKPSPDPEKDGYYFAYWFNAIDENETEWKFNKTITGDLYLKAKWIPALTVIFDADNGAETESQKLPEGGKAEKPSPDPEKDGYYFDFWYNTEDGEEWFFDTAVTKNITLKAKWIPGCTVTFNADNGAETPSQKIPEGGKAVKPVPDPVKEGHTFIHWVNEDGGGEWDFDAQVTGNIALKAKWEIKTYTVTFYADGVPAPGQQIIGYGGTAAEPETPIKPGNIFVHWFNTATGVKWNFDTPVTENIYLYPLWVTGFTVTFDADNGMPAESQLVRAGAILEEPQNPVKDNYNFVHWYNTATNTEWDFAAPVRGNITLKARWVPIVFNVTFDADNGTTPVIQQVNYGSKAIKPVPNPSKTGFSFVHWFNIADGNEWDFDTLVTGHLTLRARWVLLLEMVHVAGGSFELGKELGTAGSGDTTPISTVTLSSFYIGKYQVTQEQWSAVMEGNANGISPNPSYFNNMPLPGDSYDRSITLGEVQTRRPVEQVSWYDALVFCNRLSIIEGLTPAYSISGSADPTAWGNVPTSYNNTWNAAIVVSGSTGYRLPTEAQWEYAAKGGTSQGAYTYSGSNDPDVVAWYIINSGSMTHEAGKKQANGLGLYDMSGNVWEWCWDWYGGYTITPKTDPVGASSGSTRVGRGGYWGSYASDLRSVYRGYDIPYLRSRNVGFRLAHP